MLYKYEMHVHDSLCSRRGYNPPEVIAKVYYDRGYAGMCFTNHFLQGSTAIDKTLPWEDKVRAYWNAYLRVKDWAKDKDFDILFGLEHHYGSGKEVLTYGIDLDFLLAHPNIDVAPIKDYCDAVHEAGGFISQAHPFRRAPYIDPNVLPQPELLDAAEIYNAGNSDEDNSRGYDFAKRNHLYGTSGGDTHEQHESNIGKAGMAFPYRIKTEKELANALFRHALFLSFRFLKGTPTWNHSRNFTASAQVPPAPTPWGRSAPRTALKKNTRRQTVFSSLCTVRSPKRAKAT